MQACTDALLPKPEVVRIRLMSTRTLVNKMHASVNPMEKPFLMDGLDSVTRRVRWRLIRSQNLKVLSELSGIEMVLDVLKLFRDDVQVSMCALRCLRYLAYSGEDHCDRILDSGGLALVEGSRGGALRDDIDLQLAAKKLLSLLTKRSSALARREIALCGYCAVNRVDLKQAAELGRLVTGKTQQNSSERRQPDYGGLVDKVLGHMAVHGHEPAIVAAGVDALVELVRDATIVRDALLRKLLDAGIAQVVVHAMKQAEGTKSNELRWKSCLLVILLSNRLELAAELGKHGAARALKTAYDETPADDRESRQQAVWALGALCTASANHERLKRAKINLCVSDILENLKDARTPLEAKIALPLALRALWTDKELQRLSYETSAAAGQQQQHDEMMMTTGNVAVKKKSNVLLASKPKHGKVADSYAVGTKGLMDDDDDD